MLPLTRQWLEDYQRWVAGIGDDPPPDLQTLIALHGGYDRVRPEAWAEFDQAMAEWHLRRRGLPASTTPRPRIERLRRSPRASSVR
jgi:hypothetical protein